MFQIKFGLKISLRDFIIKDTLLNLLANNCIWGCHFSVHKPGTSPGAFYCGVLKFKFKLLTYNTNTQFGGFLSLYNRKN